VPTDVSTAAVTAANIFHHPDAHPIALDWMMLRRAGHEWLRWEGDTLRAVVEDDFAQSLSDANLAKLQACKTAHLVDTYWQRWEVFLWCTAAWNGDPLDFEVMQVPSVAQLLVSVDCAERIREERGWSPELVAYVQAVYAHDGIALALPPANFAPLDPAAFGLASAQAERLAAAWAAGARADRDPKVAEQLRRLGVVHAFLEESRARLRAQLRLVGHA
jgi:hypothetical protein